MPHFFNSLLDLIRDHANLAIALLAWVVVAEAVIIVLWARRARAARSHLEVARQTAENARALAAAALASDERMLGDNPAPPTQARTEPVPAAETELAGVAAAGDPLSELHSVATDQRLRLAPRDDQRAVPHRNGDDAPVPAVLGEDAGWASTPALSPVRDDPGWTPSPLQSSTPSASTWPQMDSGSDDVASPLHAETGGETWVAAPMPPEVTPDEASSDILLVEDDENVAKLYRLLLESRGYSVRHATDGLLALEQVEQSRPDLILLDVMMPRMGGLDFLESLRARDGLADVPVVVLSNFRNPEFVERALSLGALEYMVKAQTRPESFISAIPHWVRGRRAFSV